MVRSLPIVTLAFISLGSGCFGDKVFSDGGGAGHGEGAGVTSAAGGAPPSGGGGSDADGGAPSSGGAGGDNGGAGGAGTTSQGGAGGEGGSECAVARVFVTSASYPGNFAVGQADAWDHAQTLCDVHALAAGLGSGWQPWLSLGTSNAIDKLTGSGPWHLVDCTTGVANSKADLVDSIISHAIDRDEQGAPVNGTEEVWTGTEGDGSTSGSTCGNWTNNDASGRRGKATESGPGWTSNGNNNCSQAKHLYCFEP